MGIAILPVAAAFVPVVIAPNAPVRTPAWNVVIDGRDVSKEISGLVTQIEYIDHAHGKSDEISIDVENSDGRWLRAWYPTKGDAIELLIGYAGEQLLPCGRFEIDELEPSGPPSMLKIKALAAGVIPDLRTKRSVGYDGQTLADIARKVASRHQLTIIGDVERVYFGRVTQNREDDLSFLTRLAQMYGYVFSIRDRQLIFYRVGTLESANVVATVTPQVVSRYRFTDKTHTVYRACVVSYTDEAKKATITGSATDATVVVGETLRITERVESVAQAQARARAALHDANKREITGSLSLSGDPRLVAGIAVECKGFGKVDGKYLVESSRHTLSREGGYGVELELSTAGSDTNA